MDYEKKYKEALERAKEYLKEYYFEEAVKEIFPELKESEGKSGWQINTKDNKPQKNHSVLMQTTHGIGEGEWQGEHWHQYRWAGLVRDTDVLSWIELSDLEKQGEQKSQRMISAEAKEAMYGKPAWSEEDEKMLNSIIEDFGDGKTSNVLQEYWLKSLKERIGG